MAHRYKSITKGASVSPDNLIRLCKWIKDLSSGDSVHTYLGFERISQQELDNLCRIANTDLVNIFNGSYLIGNSMGEIVVKALIKE